MRHVPAVGGGRPVRNKGKVGVIYEQSPEFKAFNRWQLGRFLEVEREFAGLWRSQLKAADHGAMAKLAKRILKIEGSPKSLEEAIAVARSVVREKGSNLRH